MDCLICVLNNFTLEGELFIIKEDKMFTKEKITVENYIEKINIAKKNYSIDKVDFGIQNDFIKGLENKYLESLKEDK